MIVFVSLVASNREACDWNDAVLAAGAGAGAAAEVEVDERQESVKWQESGYRLLSSFHASTTLHTPFRKPHDAINSNHISIDPPHRDRSSLAQNSESLLS